VSCPVPHSTPSLYTTISSSHSSPSSTAHSKGSSRKSKAAATAAKIPATCLSSSQDLLCGQALDISAADIKVYDMPMMCIPMAKKGRFRRWVWVLELKAQTELAVMLPCI
jgi:3-dehydroquinate dehydratase